MTIDSTRGAETRTLPLFYREPVVLHSAIHATWRLTEGDMAFAADTPYIPLVLGEFGEAGRCYPIVLPARPCFPSRYSALPRVRISSSGKIHGPKGTMYPLMYAVIRSALSRSRERTVSRWRSIPLRNAWCAKARRARRCSSRASPAP